MASRPPPARGAARLARRAAGPLAVLALAAALAACNTARLAYEHADWLIERELDGYVDLDEAQRERVGAALEARLAAHRREGLPEALALLRRARALAVDGLDEASIEALLGDADALVRRTIARTVPVFTPVLADLSDAQIAHLEAEMRDRGEELREEFLPEDPEERAEQRVERAVERVEDWIGSLDDSQRALIEETLATVPYSAEQWLAWRRAMHRRLLMRLRRGDTAGELDAFLHRWWVERADRSAELVERSNRFERAWVDLIVRLDRTLSARQREHVLARIDDYLESFTPLVARPAECAGEEASSGRAVAC